MNCNNCGHIIDENTEFCPNCGTKIERNGSQVNFNNDTQSFTYGDPNKQNNIQMNNNITNNQINQSPVKVKKKPYWLLGVIPLVTWFVQFFLNVVIENMIEYKIDFENASDIQGLQFIENCLDLLSITCVLAFFPCIIVMIILYVKKK